MNPVRRRLLIVMLSAIGLCGGGCSGVRIDSDPDPINLPDLAGRMHSVRFNDHKVSAAIFITNDCPIANSYAPEINRLVADYSPRGVGFYLVHVDSTLTVEEARRHAEQYGYQCPVLLDPDHRLAKFVGATVTPEAAVIRPGDRDVLYRGRIDDRVLDFGKKRPEPTRRDLRDALDAILAGQPVPNPRTKAVGCFIPEKGK